MADRRQSEEPFPGELNEFERALRSLKPATERVDRCRLMYLAGQASAEASSARAQAPPKRNWAWPLSTAVMTSVAASLAMAMVLRSPLQPVRETIYVERPAAEQSPPEVFAHDTPRRHPAEIDRPGIATYGGYSNVSMMQTILREDDDALPETALCSIGSPRTSREMLDDLLWDNSPDKPREDERPPRPSFDWKSIPFQGEML